MSARDRSKVHAVGRATDKQAMVCCVERGETARGRCVIRAVPNCDGATYKKFAEEHLDRSAHVRADGWRGIAAGLEGWPRLDQQPFDADDPDASLPTVHHVIANFKSWALGTFHGLSIQRIQSYADEFSWRYSHRGSDATTELLRDCCAGHYTRRQLRESVFLPQPVMPKLPRKRNRKAAKQRL